MKLRLKIRDLMECIDSNRYAELSQKYGLDEEALEGLRTCLKKGNWKPLVRRVWMGGDGVKTIEKSEWDDLREKYVEGEGWFVPTLIIKYSQRSSSKNEEDW